MPYKNDHKKYYLIKYYTSLRIVFLSQEFVCLHVLCMYFVGFPYEVHSQLANMHIKVHIQKHTSHKRP